MKLLKTSLFIIYIALLAGQLTLANFRATDGDLVAAAETRLQELSTINRQLEAQITSLSSLSSIETRARQDLFQPVTASTFTPPPVAKVP